MTRTVLVAAKHYVYFRPSETVRYFANVVPSRKRPMPRPQTTTIQKSIHLWRKVIISSNSPPPTMNRQCTNTLRTIHFIMMSTWIRPSHRSVRAPWNYHLKTIPSIRPQWNIHFIIVICTFYLTIWSNNCPPTKVMSNYVSFESFSISAFG